MEIIATPEKIHRDDSRDTYWTRVRFSDSQGRELSNLYACASYEYLESRYHIEGATDGAKLNQWTVSLVKDWESRGDLIPSKPYHIQVCSITSEGYQNGVIFLQQQVIPREEADFKLNTAS